MARSPEAKLLGIPMCAPIFQVRHLLDRNNGVALSSNYTLYDDLSWRFQGCLEDFTPDVEHYSIDEVFVKMPMSSWHTLTETGREMKNQGELSVSSLYFCHRPVKTARRKFMINLYTPTGKIFIDRLREWG